MEKAILTIGIILGVAVPITLFITMALYILNAFFPDPAKDPTSNTALKNWLIENPSGTIDQYFAQIHSR